MLTVPCSSVIVSLNTLRIAASAAVGALNRLTARVHPAALRGD
jgi:hypothetical protein